MPSTETLRVRNCIYITIILYFYLELRLKSVSLNILRLELIKPNGTVILLDLDIIKKNYLIIINLPWGITLS